MLPFLNCPIQNGQLPPSLASMLIQFVSTLVTYAARCCTPIAFDRGLQHTNRTMLVWTQIPAKAVKPPIFCMQFKGAILAPELSKHMLQLATRQKSISLLSFLSSLHNNNRKKKTSDDYTLSQMQRRLHNAAQHCFKPELLKDYNHSHYISISTLHLKKG